MSKKIILCLLVCIVSLTATSQQKSYSVKDSITIVYDSLFHQLETRYIFRDKVDWKGLKPYFKTKALTSKSLKQAFDSTMVNLFDTIQGAHLNIFSKQGWYKSSLGRPLGQEDFSIEFLQKYAKKPGFETKILDEKYGYAFIPGMLLDVSQDSINRKTQQMYDAIAKIARNKEVKGWIIDLRMNVGGNVFPMLASLHYFLGNNTVYTVLSTQGDIMQLHTLKDGGFYEENILRAKANPTINPNLKIPVVFITGLMTGSAGELIPVSFRGRDNVTTVGETTYGLLSGNDLTKLPFDIKITLTTGYLCDRKGKYTETITPDRHISKEDNYTDLLKDKNIIEAIKFIEAKRD